MKRSLEMSQWRTSSLYRRDALEKAEGKAYEFVALE